LFDNPLRFIWFCRGSYKSIDWIFNTTSKSKYSKDIEVMSSVYVAPAGWLRQQAEFSVEEKLIVEDRFIPYSQEITAAISADGRTDYFYCYIGFLRTVPNQMLFFIIR
jgi:hypothetical protein